MKRLFSLTRALVARKRKIFALFFALAASIGMSWATTYVTITQSDFPSWGTSITKDGVTVSGGTIDGGEGNIMAGDKGSFTSTVGNFTKIEVNAGYVTASGEGWSGDNRRKTWTGNASSVSFSGEIMNEGMGVTIMCTIEETTAVTGVTLDKSAAELTVGGENLTLIPTVLPSNATNKEVMWTSDNGYVAVVENGGVVRPVGPGTANITVTTVDGDYSATCVVTVTDAAPANACGDGLIWELNNGELTISYTGTGTGVMDNYAKASDAPWYSYKDDITSVTITDGVKSVGKSSFSQCTSLTTVTIGNDVETIGEWAFNDCGAQFTSLTLGNSIRTIGNYAFLFGTGITGFTLPSTLETIGEYAFCQNRAITTLTIPSNVTSIGKLAFYNCNALTSITTEATTPPTLGETVFDKVPTSIPLNVPNGSVAAYTAADQWKAFNIQGYDPAPGGGSTSTNSCGDGLTWELSEGVLTISYDGVGTGEMTDFGYEYDENPVNVAPWKENKSEITTVIVGDGVKSIGNYAFNDLYENFTAVTIANSVERIGSYAFMNAKWITEITLPSSLKTIDEQCFAANFGFTSITIPSGVTSIGYKAFSYCNGLTSLTCEATTPPTLGTSVFYKITAKTSDMSSIPLYVPSGSVAAYEDAAQWNAFNIQGYDPAPTGNLKLIEFQVPASWENDNSPITSADFPGFVATTYEIASALPINSDEPALVIFDFPGDDEVTVYTKMGGQVKEPSTGTIERSAFSENAQAHYYYPVLAGGGSTATVTWNSSNVSDLDVQGTSKSYSKEGVTLSANGDDINAKWYDMGEESLIGIAFNAIRTGGYTFSNTLGKNFTKIEIFPNNYHGWDNANLGSGWSISGVYDSPFTVTWTGNASTVDLAKDESTFTGAEFVKSIVFYFEGGSEEPGGGSADVVTLINAIGTVELTAECKAKIDAARAAFIALSDGDKAQVTNYETLTTAEAAFDNVMDIWLSGDCDAILWKDTTLTIRKHAGEGNGAMADYTSYYGDNTAPWFHSRWYNPQPGDIIIKSVTVEEGVTHLGANAFGWMIGLKTLTIPSSVTSIGEDAFYWSKAVDDIYLSANPSNLTWVLPHSADNQFKPEKATRCHVPADLLTAYQETFGTLNMTFVGDLDPITPLTPEQQQALDAAKDKIAAIPSPVVYTPACKDAIDAARAAYDALTPDMLKQLVSNYATLTAAEATYENLKDVVVVEAKINEIPSPMTAENTKLSVYNKVQDARAAYDALTADQQALVSNYDKLEAAEAAFAPYAGSGDAPAGALNGKFTIDESSVVYFSKGNLQATTTDLGANWTWGFAANQWNTIGNAAANNAISGNGTVSANGTVDLFGWSTSSTKYGIHNGRNDNISDYAGDFVDWGTTMGDGWFTLSKEQWEYLFNTRTGDKAATVNSVADCRYAKATINTDGTAVMGMILFPDGGTFEASEFTEVGSPNTEDANYTTTCTTAQWNALQAKGCVFLPAAGNRYSESVSNVGSNGYYWSSSPAPSTGDAYFMFFYSYNMLPATNDFRCLGLSVRLVTEAPASSLADAQAVKDLIDAIGEVSYPDSKEAIQAAREAVDALGANASLLDDADLNKLTQAETTYAQLLAQAVAAVKDQIDALPDTPLTDATKKLSEYNKVVDAREAYDALSDEEKAAVDNYDKLTAAEAAFAAIDKSGTTIYDSGSVALTDLKIGDVLKGGVTLIAEASDKIATLRVAMNGEQKEGKFYILPFEYMNPQLGENAAISHGPNVFSPIAEDGNAGDAWIVVEGNAQATVWIRGISSAALPSVLADAQAALDKINAIPQPVVLSDDCNAAIKAARDAVTALGENASLLDDADIDKLAKAEADFALLIQDATAVADMIDAIGEVTFSAESKGKIADAREAYEALSDELKPYVSNLAVLTAAEAAYEAARPSAPVTTVPAAVEALQYTGAVQTLITAGVAEHGTILYSLDGENYSTELPTALLPGAYTVYYKVQATDDYKDVAPVTVIATIAYHYPATYSLFGIPEGWSVKVNDEEVAVVNGAVKNIAANDRFDIMPVKPEDVKRVEIVPYLLDLATVTDSVIYILDGDSITGTANGHITVVIVPDAKVYFKDVNLTNTGSHPAVLCGGNAEIVVVGENTITCTKEDEYGIRAAGAGTTLTVSGDKTLLKATIDPNGGTVNQ